MPLLDANGNMMPMDAKSEEANGARRHDQDMMDVRAVQTGTLIYNLIKVTLEETGIGNAIHQFKALKEQQKMVSDPPQLTAMEAHLREMEKYRFMFANEINNRFAAIDQARAALVPPKKNG